MSAAPETVLETADLTAFYGDFQALFGIDLHVARGETVAIIGANGAGKSTFLRSVVGQLPSQREQVTFEGQPIGHLPAHEIVRRGIALVPEGRLLFPSLSVEENLRLGAYRFRDARVARDFEAAYELFPILKDKRQQPAGGLSGGQQQMLAIARALMGRPRCLLLDEPSLGLAPILVAQILGVIKTLKSEGVTVFLVEQNAYAALAIADRAYVLETGQITMAGPAVELMADDRVREAYLGV